jgi:hypothetical protein
MTDEGCTIAPDGRSITCHRCGMTSHNSNDVAHRYCGFCKRFHEDQDLKTITIEPQKNDLSR